MNNDKIKTTIFSKDNPVTEISSKQIKTQTQEIVIPVKPKEIKNNEVNNYRLDN